MNRIFQGGRGDVEHGLIWFSSHGNGQSVFDIYFLSFIISTVFDVLEASFLQQNLLYFKQNKNENKRLISVEKSIIKEETG